jgi:hypothetical protein
MQHQLVGKHELQLEQDKTLHFHYKGPAKPDTFSAVSAD